MGTPLAHDDRTAHWLATPLGQRLLDGERAAVAEQLERVFGEELVQLGQWGEPDAFLQYARTHAAGLLDRRDGPGVAAVVDFAALPLPSHSVDAILLPHTLEYADSPHALLREVDRVLRPDGCLLILGINARGPLGWRRRLLRRAFPPGSHRLLAERRVLDWLQLLDYEADAQAHLLYGWPANRGPSPERQRAVDSWCNRWVPAAPGGAYLLRARRRISPMTLVRKPWSRRLRVVGGLARPTTRNCA